MAAPKGNQFWQLKAKHGRDTLFATPELLQEAADEYFLWCFQNPKIKIEYKGKDNERVETPIERPFSRDGLYLYLDCCDSYFRSVRHRLKDKTDADSQALLTVIARIEKVVDTQQFEGAAIGIFDSRIISRTLGLAEPIRLQGDADNPIQSKLTIEILPAIGRIASSEGEIEAD